MDENWIVDDLFEIAFISTVIRETLLNNADTII